MNDSDGSGRRGEPRNFKSPFAAANPCLLPPPARHYPARARRGRDHQRAPGLVRGVAACPTPPAQGRTPWRRAAAPRTAPPARGAPPPWGGAVECPPTATPRPDRAPHESAAYEIDGAE